MSQLDSINKDIYNELIKILIVFAGAWRVMSRTEKIKDKELFNGKKLWMPDMYADGIARGGEKAFVIYQHANGTREEITYNQIAEESDRLLVKMKEAGLQKGDRVAVISSLRPFWYSLSYTCLRAGYIMVCIDPGVPAQQVKNMLLEAETRAVFTTLGRVHLPEELDGRIPVYSIERAFPLISECEKVDVLLASCSQLPEGTFYILFSSGTTGERRKAVLLPHTTVTMGIEYGMSHDAGIYKKTAAYTPRERDLMLFPPYHIAGLLCATYDIYCNTQVIMLERLTPNGLVSALQELKPDNVCTVPSMLTSLYKKIVSGFSKNLFLKLFVNALVGVSGFLRRAFGWKAGRGLLKFLNKKAFGGNMKGFMIGASPCDEKTNRFFLDMGIDVSMAYGLTELGAPLAVTGQGYYPGTAGRVLRHTPAMDIRIVNADETGRGEVEILSPYRMISYMREEDMEGCFTEDGYFRSGDLGYFDKNDSLVICGRSKECIVLKNGEKLLPEEIESKYQDMDAISDVSVFKVPGDGGCDSFSIAVIKDKSRGLPDESMILRVYERAGKLPAIYTPKDVYVLKEFPLSSSHKVQRFRLTEMAVAGDTAPKTEAAMQSVDEDCITAELRNMLVNVGGAQWKTAELTEGMLLNLDSLQAIDLYVAIQERWGIDLFQLSSQPDTFGGLLDAVRNFEVADKTIKEEIDLSMYPLPVSASDKVIFGAVEKFAKTLWHVKAAGLENIPADTNFLICSNHRTVLDPSFISSCLPSKISDNTCIVGKADLVNDGVLKKFVVTHNIIPIDRVGNSMRTLDRCRELLEEGWNVLVFPEGTNFENNTTMFPLKEGPVRLSIATGKPIVPVLISGIAYVEAEMSTFKLPPTSSQVRVKFGEPIYPGAMTAQELNSKLRSAIENLA